MAEEHDRSVMENLYWWGVPTLFRCPHEDLADQDIVLAGVPHSTAEPYINKTLNYAFKKPKGLEIFVRK